VLIDAKKLVVLKERPRGKEVALTEVLFILVCLLHSHMREFTMSKQLFTVVLMEYI